MERRELLKIIAALTGSALIGSGALLSGCARQEIRADVTSHRFSRSDVALLDEIAETILPRTDVPGAKDAETGKLITVMVDDCYTEEQQEIFHRGLQDIQQRSRARFGGDFMEISQEQRHQLLEQLDIEARGSAKTTISGDHYFTMIKQLTLFGYFTSEVAATQAMRFIAVPGRYDGCVPYEKGQGAWAVG